MDEVNNAALVADACQDARETFPGYFAGKTDEEILAELRETIRKAREAGLEV